ncbi:MAG: cytochrome oxidase assembly protein [Gammaproteobacteria bacterium]|nr:cytochrome oxidase assembly protein [Gammaproteobacteria bacterium]
MTATDTRQLRSRNLRTLGALAALFFLPLLASGWLYYGTSWRPGGHINHGELIQPPRPLPRVSLARVPIGGDIAASDPALFRRSWTLVYVGDGSCDASCRGTLYVMRQTRLALGTDMTRLARVFLVTSDCCAKDFLAREHAGITVLDATSAGGATLLNRFPAGDRSHTLFVVDPLGNLMMRYDVRRDPRGLLVDLKRLLELSQIG